jgi:dipeptide/tripeptide permease
MGPSGVSDGAAWSFRGNGALVVPFSLGPAVIAGAWTTLVLHHRSVSHWLRWGLGVGLVGVTFLAITVAAVILFGSSGLRVAEIMNVAILAWMVVAPALAALLRTAGGSRKRAPLAHAAAGMLFISVLAAGFAAAGAVLPPGS